MREKRTNIDFSKHEVLVTEMDHVLIHYLKLPHTRERSVKFINVEGVLVVTGDYGNWVFCREFHPSPENGVSDGYWIEKLEILSSKKPKFWLLAVFDAFDEICNRMKSIPQQ